MVSRFSSGALALGVLFCATSGVVAQQLPAVSALNGKIEFDAGVLSLPSPAFMGRAAGTLTVPIGERFGLQLDASIASAPGLTTSAALHAFTRDPQSYLIGGTFGVIRTPGAIVFAAGPEAELYFDRWTVEAWAGLSYARPVAGPDRVAALVMANLGYYLSDNWRVTVGVSSLDGYSTLQLGGEYLLSDFDLPVAVTAETRVGQDGAWRGMLGLRAYLGSDDKSLMRRHREDDPADRGAALYTAAGGKTINSAPAASSPPPPNAQSPSTTDDDSDPEGGNAEGTGDGDDGPCGYQLPGTPTMIC